MGVPTFDVGYTLATAGRGDHEVHKGRVVAFEKKTFLINTYGCDDNGDYENTLMAMFSMCGHSPFSQIKDIWCLYSVI
jgi:hypothetical protein